MVALASLHEDQAQGPGHPAPRVIGQLRSEAKDEGGAVDRYDLARTSKIQEEARKLRRMNQEAEGHSVLAAEVEGQTRRLIAQEVAKV